MKSTAKKFVLAAALIGATLTGAEQANAMPMAQAGVSQSAPIENIGWRCGPGWHVNPWGRCVPNRGGWGPRRRFRRW